MTTTQAAMPFNSFEYTWTNGALESYVKAAALELENIRINTVSPIFVKETMAMMGMDTDSGLSAEDTTKAYVATVTGDMTGKTLDAPDFA